MLVAMVLAFVALLVPYQRHWYSAWALGGPLVVAEMMEVLALGVAGALALFGKSKPRFTAGCVAAAAIYVASAFVMASFALDAPEGLRAGVGMGFELVATLAAIAGGVLAVLVIVGSVKPVWRPTTTTVSLAVLSAALLAAYGCYATKWIDGSGFFNFQFVLSELSDWNFASGLLLAVVGPAVVLLGALLGGRACVSVCAVVLTYLLTGVVSDLWFASRDGHIVVGFAFAILAVVLLGMTAWSAQADVQREARQSFTSPV
jgi:hypothetical protein